MPIEEMIYSRLTATTALTDLVSTRIYPLVRPQDSVIPSVVYWRVSNPIIFAMSTSDEISTPRFQFDCYGASFSATRSVARQVKKAIDRWGTSTGTPVVIRSDVVNEMDDYDSDLSEYQSIVEAIIYHSTT
jgi:hypothetical protein